MAEFLYETRLFPDLEYTFKHALTHEVTYGGLLQEHRRNLHGRIVDAIETLHRDRRDAEIERLAHHALRAELGDKAARFLRQAGEKAAARSALSEAKSWFEQALSVLATLPESASTLESGCDIRLELRPVLVLAELGQTATALDRLREADRYLTRERQRGLVANLGWFFNALGRASLRLGRLDEAQRMCERALESSPHHPGHIAHAQHLLGDLAIHPDRLDAESGEAQYRQALALAKPRGMRPLVAHCHLGLGKLYWRTGKREQAREHLTTATTMYREMDMRFWLVQAEAVTIAPAGGA